MSTREGPETDHLENPTAEERAVRTADDIPNRDYTSKRKVQRRVLKYLSGGNLIATLYAVKWTFTVVSRRRRHEWCANDMEMCKFYNEVAGKRVNNMYSGA